MNTKEATQQKIAEIIESCTPEELRAVVDTPYSHEDSKMAMTVGFCDKLAEFGLVPSDMDAMMTKRAEGGLGSGLVKGIGLGTLGLTIAAAVIGNMTGKTHYDINRRLDKMDSKDNVRLREKAKLLAAQRDELAEDLSSRGPSTPPDSKARSSSKSNDVIQLLD